MIYKSNKTQSLRNNRWLAGSIAAACMVSLLLAAAGCGEDSKTASQVEAAKKANKSKTPASAPGGKDVVPLGVYKPKIGHYGGRIVLDALGEPKSFNPVTSGETSTSIYTGIMYEGLTQINSWTFEVEPLLAESWTHDETGLVWDIKLRKDVKWSDGAGFTADDVIFTYDTIYDERWISGMRDIITGPNGEKWKLEKLDDYSVRFTLFAPNAIFTQLIASGILPKHKFKPLIDSGKFNEALGTDSDPDDFVGTGPFIINQYVPGEKVVLKRNPNYYRVDAEGNRLPYLSELIYVISKDMDVRLTKFLNGELDVLGSLNGIRGEDYPVLADRRQSDDFKLYKLGPAGGANFIFFNLNSGKNDKGEYFVAPHKLKWFSDVRFRRAVSHLVDRDFFVRSIYNGLGYPQYGPLNHASGYFFCNPDIQKFEYDPEKARQLLSEMGLIDRDGDGVLEDPAGNPVEFTLITNTSNTVRVKIAESIRSELEGVGMRVNFRPQDFNNIVGKLDATFDWEACLLGLTGGPEPHWGANVWRSSGRMHMWNPKQQTPATEWEAEIDKIFAEAVQQLDREKRRQMYFRWQEIVGEQQPFVYTVTPEVVVALRNKFDNVFPAVYGGVLHNVDEFFIKDSASTAE